MLRRAGSHALRIVVVAGAYFLAGRLSNLLAIPPGYATAVWPPAGMAMAAAIVWGSAILPGVWLGSLGLNLIVGSDPIVAASIALGATLQAAAGAWITRRIAGPGNPLDGAQSPLGTLFVAGPLSCLVSASWGMGTLLAAEEVTAGEVPYSWATWWAGDTIGVLVFLPPLLAWTARPPEIWRVRRWILTGPLIVCCTAVGLFFVYARSIEERRAGIEFYDHQRPIAEAIQRELTRTVDTVDSLASFFDASNFVRRDEFSVFTAPRLGEGLGLLALAWNPIVRSVDRDEYEGLARADGIAGYTFLDQGPDGALRPEGERTRYVPILYIEPAATNQDSLGFDIASEPVRGAAVRAAVDCAAPIATARIRLLHEKGEAWSVLLLMPVYISADAPASVAARRETVRGFAVGVLRMTDLVECAVKGLDRSGLVIRIRDMDAPASERLLYGDEPGEAPSRFERHTWQNAQRPWEIEIASGGPAPRAWLTWVVLVGGLLFTGFFGAFVLEIGTRHIHVERLVAVRTGELARANEELQRSNLELQRFAHVASHDLREPLRAIGSFAQLLEESAPELSPDHRKFLERIVAAAHRMQALVDDLLSLSRLEGGAGAMSSVPLRELVDLALENLRPAIDASKATVEVAELPTVSCDPSQVVQLFQNLIANALKFRREGVPPSVRVSSRRIGDHWEIAVKDNGIGISPEHHARIFEMFERLHPREKYGGTGIGLAVCRRVVDRHGGRIWLESPPEGGSVFRFTLPAEGEPG